MHSGNYIKIKKKKLKLLTNFFFYKIRQLIDGAKTLKIIEQVDTFYESPLRKIVITECGKFSVDQNNDQVNLFNNFRL